MKYRNDLARGVVLPASFVNELQEYIATLTANVAVTTASATSVQVVAGAGDDQVALGIDGLWRYNTATVTAAMPASPPVGTYDVWAVASANSFANTPAPDTDNTDYSFGLQVLAQGTNPSGNWNGNAISAYRRIATLVWDGARITQITQLVAGAVTNPHATTHQPGGSDPISMDPNLFNVQQGVASGGDTTWINSTTIRIAAGKGWVQVSGLLRPVTWVQTDVNIPNAVAARGDRIVIDSSGTVQRQAGTDNVAVTHDNIDTYNTAVPAGKFQVATVIAGAGATGVSATNATGSGFRDRRPWAHGFNGRVTDAAGTSPQGITSGTWTLIHTSTFSMRAEMSGKPFRWRVQATVSNGNTPGYVLALMLYMDGAAYGRAVARSVDNLTVGHEWSGEADGPTAGSHLFTVAGYYSLAGASVNIGGSGSDAARLFIGEDLRGYSPLN